MRTPDEDEEKSDEAVLEQRRQQYLERSKNFGGRACTKEELDAIYKSMHPEGLKFPDSDGSEIANLSDSGDINILFTANEPEMKASGNRVYKPGDKNYQYYWKRHCFDDPKGKNHVIKTNGQEKSG